MSLLDAFKKLPEQEQEAVLQGLVQKYRHEQGKIVLTPYSRFQINDLDHIEFHIRNMQYDVLHNGILRSIDLRIDAVGSLREIP